jgi:hypothetical protein
MDIRATAKCDEIILAGYQNASAAPIAIEALTRLCFVPATPETITIWFRDTQTPSSRCEIAAIKRLPDRGHAHDLGWSKFRSRQGDLPAGQIGKRS